MTHDDLKVRLFYGCIRIIFFQRGPQNLCFLGGLVKSVFPFSGLLSTKSHWRETFTGKIPGHQYCMLLKSILNSMWF